MEKLSILYIGRNTEITETVIRLLNSNDQWIGFGANTDEEAITMFQQHPCAIILLGNGIEEESENYLRNYFKTQRPDIIIIQHYGGGSGLLTNEIMEALHNKK